MQPNGLNRIAHDARCKGLQADAVAVYPDGVGFPANADLELVPGAAVELARVEGVSSGAAGLARVERVRVDSLENVGGIQPSSFASNIIERTVVMGAPNDTVFVGFFLMDSQIQVLHEGQPLSTKEWIFSPTAGRIYFRVAEDTFAKSTRVTIRYPQPALFIPESYRLRFPPALANHRAGVAIPSTRTIPKPIEGIDADSVSNHSLSNREDRMGQGQLRGAVGGGVFSEGGSDLAERGGVGLAGARLDGVDLIQSGSLSRGFTIGNRQDLSLESGLRLNLSGDIAENVSITAVLTDRSTPIQPDGTTQTLREFDRIFIEMRTPEGWLQMGDVDLDIGGGMGAGMGADASAGVGAGAGMGMGEGDEGSLGDGLRIGGRDGRDGRLSGTGMGSEFAAIRRRVQGASARYRRDQREVASAFSLVRGTFHSMDFRGREGVQGPYRLQGAAGERTVLVIAGSERVFLDGERLTRGRDHDYIIDYSLGEITFTHRRLITENHRVSVDFEYRTGDYPRSLMVAQGRDDRMMDGRMSVGATYIREADGKNSLLYQSLTNEQTLELQSLEEGDVLRISGAVLLGPGEEPDGPVYVRRDTVVFGGIQTIYLPAEGSGETLYRVQFSNVGDGNGSYQRSSGNQNGAVFVWVGTGLGRYEPVIEIQPPESHQMVSLTGQYRFHEKVRTYSEWAVSQVQRNRFSAGSANVDQAIRQEWVAEGLDFGRGELSARLRYRSQTDGFRVFGRQNPVEFERYWNLGVDRQELVRDGTRRDELELEVLADLENEVRVSAGGGYLKMAGAEGLRAESEIQHTGPVWPEVWVRSEWVQQEDWRFDMAGGWFRQAGRVRKELALVAPFFRWELEHRAVRSKEGLLSAESLTFDEIHPGLALKGSWYVVEAGVALRQQRLPSGNEFLTASKARTTTVTINLRPSPRFTSENSIQFRTRDAIHNLSLPELTPSIALDMQNMMTTQNHIWIQDQYVIEDHDWTNNDRLYPHNRSAIAKSHTISGSDISNKRIQEMTSDPSNDASSSTAPSADASTRNTKNLANAGSPSTVTHADASTRNKKIPENQPSPARENSNAGMNGQQASGARLNTSTKYTARSSAASTNASSTNAASTNAGPTYAATKNATTANSSTTNTVLVRSFTRLNTLFGLDTDLLYEVNTGQKSLYQEAFLEVGTEAGYYVWEDLNEDGLQQLDEFFQESSPDEGLYVLQYLPSDELFTTADLNVRLTAEMDLLQLREYVGGGSSMRSSVGRRRSSSSSTRYTRTTAGQFSWSAVLDLKEVSTEQELEKVYLLHPDVLLSDETTLNGSWLHTQRLNWNTGNRNHEGALQYRMIRSVNRRAGGLEKRLREQLAWSGDLRFTRHWRMHWQWMRGRSVADSEQVRTRNFQIVMTELQQGIEFIPNRSASLDLMISWADNRNRVPGEALKASVWVLALHSQIALFQRLQSRAGIQLQHTQLSQDGNPHLIYEISNGLGSGTRVRWNASSSYRTRGQLTFSLQIHGRTTMMNRVIQTAKFSVQANF